MKKNKKKDILLARIGKGTKLTQKDIELFVQLAFDFSNFKITPINIDDIKNTYFNLVNSWPKKSYLDTTAIAFMIKISLN